MFGRLGTGCHDHRRLVVALWFVALITGGVLNGAVGSDFSSQLKLPNVESTRGTDIIERDFGGRGGGASASIVFEADQGVTDPAVQAAMTEYFTAVTDTTGVRVISPYDPAGADQIALSGDKAGKVAYARL